MICHSEGTMKIFVVDAQPDDYSDFIDASLYDTVQFTFYERGRDALRTNPEDDPEVWVINMELPDMAGTELYGMLRSRGSQVPILMISNSASVDDEIIARTTGATMYFAKPLRPEWILAIGSGTS